MVGILGESYHQTKIQLNQFILDKIFIEIKHSKN